MPPLYFWPRVRFNLLRPIGRASPPNPVRNAGDVVAPCPRLPAGSASGSDLRDMAYTYVYGAGIMGGIRPCSDERRCS